MAEKSVTLVTVPSSSGEQEKILFGRRWATSLGMLTFSIGILTQQWQLAVVGIVFSYLTAAAMWQNFRARLAYLYDPWSEKLPPPPTLMHAMIAITIMVEVSAVVTGIVVPIAGTKYIPITQALAYTICAGIVSIVAINFLINRGVRLLDICLWYNKPMEEFTSGFSVFKTRAGSIFINILIGALGGFLLGLVAIGYIAILKNFPETAEAIEQFQMQMAKNLNLRHSYAFIAIGVAPFAEEYLFRGLLYRALDREWGGWRAVVGSAAFFAIYHPTISWIPVGLLGIFNALLFKKTGNLATAIVFHMIYNIIIVIGS
jgi:membrane protease YdiL (CAAX protease family)